MSRLAFNVLCLQSMKGKYQILLGLLPVVSIFSVLLPFIYFISYLEDIQGIPLFNLTYENPEGWLWISVFALFVGILLFMGYSIGWILNALIIKLVLNWPSQKTNVLFLHSELPNTWLKPDLALIKNTKELKRAILAHHINSGIIRFILIRGILTFGGPLFIFPAVLEGKIISSFIGALVAGTVFGILSWQMIKQEYMKQNTPR